MIRIQKILVPVDFSDPSRTAARYGASLAEGFGAKLILAHIVPSSAALDYAFPTETYAIEKNQVEQAKTALPDLVPEERREALDVRTIVKIGDVQNELMAIVSDEAVDIVVMGTHGRSGFERLLLGSLTERLLRKLPVPVLTVSHLDAEWEGGPSEAPFRHVLYATDLSNTAESGMKFALELAGEIGAKLTVLHVFNIPEMAFWSAEGGYIPLRLDEMKEDALRQLGDLIPAESGPNVRSMMVEGEPFREILRIAGEDKADLIVLNLQGKGLMERALLGATAERVIRSAHIPVLSIPAAATAAKPTAKDRRSSAA